MEDREFLDYCETHVLSDRAGLLPEHLARLYRMAGEDRVAVVLGMIAESVAHSHHNSFGLIIEATTNPFRAEIRQIIKQARERL